MRRSSTSCRHAPPPAPTTDAPNRGAGRFVKTRPRIGQVRLKQPPRRADTQSMGPPDGARANRLPTMSWESVVDEHDGSAAAPLDDAASPVVASTPAPASQAAPVEAPIAPLVSPVGTGPITIEPITFAPLTLDLAPSSSSPAVPPPPSPPLPAATSAVAGPAVAAAPVAADPVAGDAGRRRTRRRRIGRRRTGCRPAQRVRSRQRPPVATVGPDAGRRQRSRTRFRRSGFRRSWRPHRSRNRVPRVSSTGTW